MANTITEAMHEADRGERMQGTRGGSSTLSVMCRLLNRSRALGERRKRKA